MNNKANAIYQKITNRIIDQLEQDQPPWLQPWSTNGNGSADGLIPYNAFTRRPYHGMNVVALWLNTDKYQSHGYLSFRQAKKAGGHVKKGEHGHTIYFFKMMNFRDKEIDLNGEETTVSRRVPLIRQSTVFNTEQCEGLNLKQITPPTVPDNPATHLAQQNNVDLRHGGERAYYRRDGDFVQMPRVETFKSEDSYQATLFHELTHWSGNSKRLDRTFGKRFGDDKYAFEELVAEMGSAFLCAMNNVKGEQRHVSYLKSWLRVLKNDNRAIFTAASRAQAAADYLSTAAQEVEQAA